MSSIDASTRPPPAIPSRESSVGATGGSESEKETDDKRPPEPKKFNLVDISKIQPPPPVNRDKPSTPSNANRPATGGHQTGNRAVPPPPPARTLPKPPRSEPKRFGRENSSPSSDPEEPSKPKKFNLIEVSSIGPPPPKIPPLRRNEQTAENNNKSQPTSSYGTNRFSHSHSPASLNLSGSSSPSPYPDHPPPAYSPYNYSATNSHSHSHSHSPSPAPALPARHTPIAEGASSTASSIANVSVTKKAPPPKPVKRKSAISEAHLLVDMTGGSMKNGSPAVSDHPPVKPPRPSTKPAKPLKPMKPNKSKCCFTCWVV
ncbi:unnamed protein product [Ambrosiozyma monospora]|uniref:Unnamed protein product n=1 Tax=Ambrosiozyma monospora TaxID=43982 RepID=A0ACB5TY83_AMBMO|nr:unnamed protein product [Ambrosiozyma monospora]